MNLYQEFLIIAGIICGLAGCASTSDEVVTSTKAASVQSSETSSLKSLTSNTSIYFDYDKSDVKAEFTMALGKVAEFLKKMPKANVKIETLSH